MTGLEAEQLRQRAYSSYQQGDIPGAVSLCEQILRKYPEHPQATYLLGAIALERGQMPAAVNYLARAARTTPANAVYINALGEARIASGDREAAIGLFNKAIAAQPGYERAHNNLGMQYFAQKQVKEAIASFSKAVQLNPKYATAHNNLGAAYQHVARFDLAESHFRQALQWRTKYPEASFNLATILHARGQLADASIQLRQAIEQRPTYAKAISLLARVSSDMGKVEAAIELLQRAVELEPGDGASWLVLGNLLRLVNRTDPARLAYQRALAIDPSDAYALAGLLRLKDELCDWTNRQAELDKVMELTRQCLARGIASPIAALHATALPFSPAEIRQIAATQARSIARRIAKPNTQSPAAGPRDRLRVGYVSRDLYDHPVAHQIVGVFPLHDRARFEIHAYSFGPNDSSAYRRAISQGCECFHDVVDLSADQLVQRIAMDRIDILVDLMGHTGMARLDCFAARPAPINVTWLGYPGTLGGQFIDYLIGDQWVTPASAQDDYAEMLVRLPGSFMPTDGRQAIANAASDRKAHGLPEDAIVFACFNSSFKIEPTIFALWMRILTYFPDSVLWLSSRHPEVQQNLRREAQSHGVDPARVIFAEFVADKANHLARLRLADLFLDAHYYNAHATACDWLWAGVPVLTWPGATFAARVGCSLVNNVGLADFVAQTPEDYVAKAIGYAQDRGRRDAVRAALAAGVRTSRLFDTAAFVRSLESAYQQMWDRHAQGLPPAPLDIKL